MVLDKFISAYEEKRKRYKELPSFEELNNEFEISNFIQDKNYIPVFVLRAVRRMIANLIISWSSYLQMFIVPNQQSIISMQDVSSLNDKEKNELTKILEQLTILAKESYLCELKRDEKIDVEFIIKSDSKWRKIKPSLVKLTEANIAFWEKSRNK